MAGATDDQTTVDEEVDQTVLSLIPAPSKRRSLLLVTAAFGVLIAVWFSRPWLAPSISENYPEAPIDNWSGLSHLDLTLSQIGLTTYGNHFEIVSVSDVPGAELVGVWAFADWETGRSGDESPNPRDFVSGHEYAQASFNERDLKPSTNLPVRITSEQAQLILLWQIHDCSSLDATKPPLVTMKSAIGTKTTEALANNLASPAFAPERAGCTSDSGRRSSD